MNTIPSPALPLKGREREPSPSRRGLGEDGFRACDYTASKRFAATFLRTFAGSHTRPFMAM
jgi:hypothetical protein